MAEVSIGNNDYPVFADIEFADEYLGGDMLRGPIWEAADETTQGRGLVTGTRRLLRLTWKDGPPSIESPPDVVKEANAILAADIIADPEKGDNSGTGSNIKRVRAGPAEVEFFRAQEGRPLPTSVWEMLVASGLLASNADDGSGPYVGGIRHRSHFPGGCDVDRPAWRDTGDWGMNGCD